MLNLVKRFNPVHTDTNVLQFHEQPESQFQTQLITSISFSLIQLVSENRSRPSFKSKIKAQAHSPFKETSLIIGLIYIDRLCKKKKIVLTEFK